MNNIFAKNRPSVAVLLSTYNGEKFLREQLDSVLSQKDVDVELIIRDDGSSDGTVTLLNKYSLKYSNITLLLEDNVGCEESFEKLIRYASFHTDSDYYSFCDQDDVWYAEKLSLSISAIGKDNEPCMYCCNQVITDGSLNPKELFISEEKYDSAVRRLEQNYLLNRHGCTLVWNKPLQSILGNFKYQFISTPIHDVWATLVARCAGKVIIGKEPLMYYRVHGNNTGGYERNKWKRLKKGVKLYLARTNNRNLYAKECLFLLDKNKRHDEGANYIRKVASYKDSFFKRIKLVLSPQIRQYGRADGYVYALSVLLGKY